MHENNELPIVVGGTSYWIQHLIFPNRLVSKEPSASQFMKPINWSDDLKHSISELPPDLLALLQNLPQEAPSAKLDPDKAFQLYRLLSALDPIVAQRWHWKDTRKVLRSLEIMIDSGKPPSSIILEQSTSPAADTKPRYVLLTKVPYLHYDIFFSRFRTLSFWLYADSSSLHPRLDARVDDMISVRITRAS